MRSRGLIIAGGSSIDSGPLLYDTRNKHLSANLLANPKHLDILDNFNGGTALQLTGILNDYKEEVLFQINHNLKFTPETLAYMLIKSISNDASQGGGYAQNAYFYSGSAGTFKDVLTIRADASTFQIVHILQDFGFSSIWTSPAPNYLFRIKYFIFANSIDKIL